MVPAASAALVSRHGPCPQASAARDRRPRGGVRAAHEGGPRGVPWQVPEDGRRPVRVLPWHRLPLRPRRGEGPGPVGDRATQPVLNQRDLHAENFGTYMNSHGELIFDVNDFDEAYLGPFS